MVVLDTELSSETLKGFVTMVIASTPEEAKELGREDVLSTLPHLKDYVRGIDVFAVKQEKLEDAAHQVLGWHPSHD